MQWHQGCVNRSKGPQVPLLPDVAHIHPYVGKGNSDVDGRASRGQILRLEVPVVGGRAHKAAVCIVLVVARAITGGEGEARTGRFGAAHGLRLGHRVPREVAQVAAGATARLVVSAGGVVPGGAGVCSAQAILVVQRHRHATVAQLAGPHFCVALYLAD